MNLEFLSAFLTSTSAMKYQAFLAKLWRKRLTHRTTTLGMRCFPQQSRVPNTLPILEVRDIRPSDAPRILPPYHVGKQTDESILINSRREILKRDPSRCKVVIDKGTGTPCFFFWIARHHPGTHTSVAGHGSFPPLRAGQAVLGYAYTHPLYRRRVVLEQILRCVVLHTASEGTRELFTFVKSTESRLATALRDAGFFRFLRRTETSFFGGLLRSFSFESIAGATPSERSAISSFPITEALL